MKKLFIIMAILPLGLFFASFDANLHVGRIQRNTDDSFAAERQKIIGDLMNGSLKDKGSLAADSVFSNLTLFTAFHRLEVTHLLAVMNYWGEALGVSCYYCHVHSSFSSDSLRTKRIAREMYAMRQTINGEILSKMDDLASKPATINCGTCHNGNKVPKKD